MADIMYISQKLLREFDLVIFVVSTTGQGEVPKNGRKFWKGLLRRQLPPGCLAAVQFTTFGLGDSSYSKFNWAARKLHKRLEQLGACEFYPRGEADERHDDGIDGAFIPWYTSLRAHFLSTKPLPDDLPPIPVDVRLPPKYTIEHLSTMEWRDDGTHDLAARTQAMTTGQESTLDSTAARFSHVDAVDPHQQEQALRFDRMRPENNVVLARLSEQTSKAIAGGINTLDRPNVLKDDPSKYALTTTTETKDAPPPAHCLPIPDSYEAYVTKNERVTPLDHWQDVRSITIVFEHAEHANKRHQQENAHISPGTVVTIFPKNFLTDVQSLIDLMGWGEIADKPFQHHSRLNLGFTQAPEPQGCYPLPRSTLRELLIHNYDITAIPKRIFFELIAWYTTDETHQERLREFADPKYTDEFYDYTSRPRRSILEILHDFPTVKIPVSDVPSIFPVIRGREYSIASGGVKCHPHPGVLRLDILVALVKYKTVLRKVRQGLCSRYLAAVEPNTPIVVRISAAHKGPPYGPGHDQRPLIAIAPGTGVAPMRSLIWTRRSHGGGSIHNQHQTGQQDHVAETQTTLGTIGKEVLFFGGRNRNADFFYSSEWNDLGIEVHGAFSRDQREKIYVQDLIRKQGKLICDLIARQNAIICLCGSSGKMPEAVRQALCDVLVEGRIATDQEAAKKLFDEPNRYWEEVW